MRHAVRTSLAVALGAALTIVLEPVRLIIGGVLLATAAYLWNKYLWRVDS